MLKKIASVVTCLFTGISIILSAPIISIQATSQFSFNKTMSESVLLKYLSRSVSALGMCGGGGDASENMLFEEDLRMVQRIGAKFISRAAVFAWSSTNASQVEFHFGYAKKMAAIVHKADPEIILQAFVAEIVRKSYVDNIKIPSWVFEAFGKPVENRNFSFVNMINDKKGANFWATNAGYPDYSKEEALFWYYYCIRNYIDAGYESIHIQQGEDSSELNNVNKLLTMARQYAKTKARRGIVLFHNFFDMVNGENKIGDRLLFDINGNGLVPNETVKENGVLKCKISYPSGDYWLTWFGRSRGGQHPLGFVAEICPTILEFDNYGQIGPLGVSNGPAFGVWGYDDITWFATQPEWYRNQFLLYLDDYMKKNCLKKSGKQVYYPVYTMTRCITADPNYPTTVYKPSKNFNTDFLFDYCDSYEKIKYDFNADSSFKLTSTINYRANRQSDGCPNGFNQEDTIRQIFLGKNAVENPAFNKVVLPSKYMPNSISTTTTTYKGGTSKASTKSAVSTKSGLLPTNTVSGSSSNSGTTVSKSQENPSSESSVHSSVVLKPITESLKFPVLFVIIGSILLLVGGGAIFYFKKIKS